MSGRLEERVAHAQWDKQLMKLLRAVRAGDIHRSESGRVYLIRRARHNAPADRLMRDATGRGWVQMRDDNAERKPYYRLTAAGNAELEASEKPC